MNIDSFMAMFYKVLSYVWIITATAIILWLLNHVIIGH